MPQVWIGHYPSLLLRPFLFHKYALAGLNATDGGRVDYSRVEASDARVKFSPTGDAWTGIRDSTSIELDHVQRAQAAHCQIIAEPRQM
jgi:hypothetical protein